MRYKSRFPLHVPLHVPLHGENEKHAEILPYCHTEMANGLILTLI